jgi:hypothetical protein
MKKYVALALLVLGMMGLSVNGQTITTVVSNALFEPYGIAVYTGGDKNVYYITENAAGSVFVYNFDTGSGTNLDLKFNSDWPASDFSSFDSPQGVVITADNKLIIADSGNHALAKVDIFTGDVSLFAGGTRGSTNGVGAAAQFNSPAGLSIDSNGNVYVADMLNGSIRLVTPGGVVSTLATGLYKPAGVAVDQNNDRIFIADTMNHSIRVILGAGMADNSVTNRSAVANPALFAGSGSSFLFGDRNASVASNALFNRPRGLFWAGEAVGLLVCDTDNGKIKVIARAGANYSVSTYANSDKANLVRPFTIARDFANNMPVIDNSSGDLRMIAFNVTTTPVSNPTIGVVRLVTDITGQTHYRMTAITNVTYNNDEVFAIMGEEGTDTVYTKGNNSFTLPGPKNPGESPLIPADKFHDPQDSLPKNILTINDDGPIIVIKAYSRQHGRKPSDEVTAEIFFQCAGVNIVGKNPDAVTFESASDGVDFYYTVDGSKPTESSKKYAGEPLDIYNREVSTTADVTVKVIAAKRGYATSDVSSRVYKYSDRATVSIGFPSTNYVAGVGSTIVVPVVARPTTDIGLKTLQFRVEVTPTNGNLFPILVNQFRPLDIDSSKDFIVLSSTETNKALGAYKSYSLTNNGVITRGLEIYWIGTNANLSVKQDQPVVLVAVPIPPSVKNGNQYLITIKQASGTSDAGQSHVNVIPLPDRYVTIKKVEYVVGDSAYANWYNAGDFGSGSKDGYLNNNDVNNAFYSSLGIRVPFTFTDVFDAMDAFPLDSTDDGALAGGDGQIRFLDWQIILDRSLRLDTNNWVRYWDENDGLRHSTGKFDINKRASMPAQSVSKIAKTTDWFRQGLIYAKPMENATPGQFVRVPVYARVKDGFELAGLQFKVTVEAGNGAPELDAAQPAAFVVDGTLPQPPFTLGQADGAKANTTGVAWALNNLMPPIRNEKLLGYVQFTIPGGATAGQKYIIRFSNADGAPDIQTQYDLETIPAIVWVGTDAQAPQDVISDEWKLKFFNTLNSKWAGANQDTDGDGVTNLEKFLAGVNPTKLKLRLNAAEGQAGLKQSEFKFQWFGVFGRRYVVEKTTDLLSGNWTAVAESDGQDDIAEIADPGLASAVQLYRVREVQQ